jgi:hypothetical protein
LFIGRLTVTAVSIVMSGCAYMPFIHRVKPDQNVGEGRSRIISYYVAHNAGDHLAVSVKYFYDGERGGDVSIGAITQYNGRSDGYWSYRSGPVFQGEHWARVLVGMSNDAPSRYDSNEIKFSIYQNGGSEFVDTVVKFPKRWRRSKNPRPCHLKWGRGCGG